MTGCSQGYASQGCIGTAVHAHTSALPFTGFAMLNVILIAGLIIILGVVILWIDRWWP